MSTKPIEIHFEKHLNNLSLVQAADRSQHREFLVLTLLALLIVFGLVAYGWQHYQYQNIGYRFGEANKVHTRLLKERASLRAHRQTLRSSGRIDDSARRLGMVSPAPGQIRQAPLEGGAFPDAELAAQQ